MDQLTLQFEQARLGQASSASLGRALTEADLDAANSLVQSLAALAEKKIKGKAKRNMATGSKHPLEIEQADGSKTTLEVTSWKMNEYEYVRGTLPSLARGLFTYTEQGRFRILIRGYDKFFNIGETEKTSLDWIDKETLGPYEVTLKENGCIIFMAGLPPHLTGGRGGCVVSSKHSLGIANADEGGVSHSAKGKEWLQRSLTAKGKTLEEFGSWLWSNNLTAVAELCDDSFEEHVLEYPAEKAGLYLHGLNRNTAGFETLPSDRVQEVASTWGLWPTDYVALDSHQKVQEFADKIRNAGEYDSRAVEGFVVRCKTKATGDVYFFKIKYDEPYLMYREWREVTKRLLIQEAKAAADIAKAKAWAEKASKSNSKVAASEEPVEAVAEAAPSKLRMKYPLTKAYVVFVKGLMKDQPELFEKYNHNQGIIAVREMFLKEWNAKSTVEQEASMASSAKESGNMVTKEFERTVIIPIATIGCGKTTVSVALSKLFGWGHVCSDDFQHLRKNSGQRFIKEVVNQLQENMVVIADRNNHEYLHRERIMEAVQAKYPQTRFVALFWSHEDMPMSRIRELEVHRVEKRGNNHQNMTPDYCPIFEDVIQRFLNSFEPLNPMLAPDSLFSIVVQSKVGEESQTFVERIVKEFAIPFMGTGGMGNYSIPTVAEIQEAARYAREEWSPKRVTSGEAEKFHKAKQEPRGDTDAAKTIDVGPSLLAATTSQAPEGAQVSKNRKAREPRYFAVSVERGAVLHFLEEQINMNASSSDSIPDYFSHSRSTKAWAALQLQISEWKEKQRIVLAHHVTLIHSSARQNPSPPRAKRAEELWQKYANELAAPSSTLSSAQSSATSSAVTSPRQPLMPTSTQLTAALEDADFTPVVKKSNRRAKSTGSQDKPLPVPLAASPSSSSPVSPTSTPGINAQLDTAAIVTVDAIVWTDRIITLRVSKLTRAGSGKQFETVQPILHITAGTLQDSVKAYESNDVLRKWSSHSKEESVNIQSIKLDRPKVFTGELKGMMF